MKILYVEDSETLRNSVTRGLRSAGYTVENAKDGEEGLSAALVHEFDVIILDIMLPHVNGFDILKQIRKEGITSEVLMLSARNSVEDRVTGLDLGADDYLIKPFAFEELLARVRVLMRRRFGKKTNSITLGKLEIDLAGQRLFCDGDEVVIRPREFDILSYLALRQGKIVSRSELISHVYDHAVDLKSNAVDSAVCNIRKALSLVGFDGLISTVPRRGYLLEYRPN